MFKIFLSREGYEQEDWNFKEYDLMTEKGQSDTYKFIRENPDYTIVEYDNEIEYEVGEKEDTDVLISISDVLKEKNIKGLDEIYHDIQTKDFKLTYAVGLSGLSVRKELIFDRWIAENL